MLPLFQCLAIVRAEPVHRYSSILQHSCDSHLGYLNVAQDSLSMQGLVANLIALNSVRDPTDNDERANEKSDNNSCDDSSRK